MLLEVVHRGVPRLLDAQSAEAAWARARRPDPAGRVRAWFDEEQSCLFAFLTPGPDQAASPHAVASITTATPPHALDIQFLDRLVRVFSDDVSKAPTLLRDDELWGTLRQTAFRRAITKYSAFKTQPMLRWLDALEVSTHLRYEGQPFATSVIMTYNEDYVASALGTAYIRLHHPMTFTDAVLGEKWLRAVTRSDRIGMVGLSSGTVVGLYVVPATPDTEANGLEFAPHSRLRGVQRLVHGGTCALVTSLHGDARVLLPNGTTFLNAQGRWQYLRFGSVLPALLPHVGERLAGALVRTALDLSYERQGALICVMVSRTFLPSLIPDHHDPRTNSLLRHTVRGLSLLRESEREVVISAACADGALILDGEGAVLDVGSMVTDPPDERLRELSITRRFRGAGARETAAWGASLYGLACKVSSDGPVTFYFHGEVIARLGNDDMRHCRR